MANKWKTFFLVCFTLGMALPPSDSLHLVWKDNFDGNTLNSSKWKSAPEWFRQGGSYWSNNNYRLNGEGQLILSVNEQNDSVFAGAIRTHKLFDQSYGYFEVKCKLPQIKGGWAAFWMMPYGNKPGQEGLDGTEIDIFESINGWNNKIQHALHWDGYAAEHKKESKSFTRADLYDGKFHTFGMWWSKDQYRFYIDDVETWSTQAGGVSTVPQYLKLTMEITNQTWAGDWQQQKLKPIEWEIDYVKVYEWRDSSRFPVKDTTTMEEAPTTSILLNPNKFSVNYSWLDAQTLWVEPLNSNGTLEVYSLAGELLHIEAFQKGQPIKLDLTIHKSNVESRLLYIQIKLSDADIFGFQIYPESS